MLGSEREDKKSYDSLEPIKEVDGSLASQKQEDKLMKTVLQSDKDQVDQGKVIIEAINKGINAFNPDIMFENMANNFSMAKKLYGKTLIRFLAGYDDSYVEKNIRIPEFKKQLSENIKHNIERLQDNKILDKKHFLTDNSYELAAINILHEEVDKVSAIGSGEKTSTKKSHYGQKTESRDYRKGDRYKDLDIKKSIKKSIRRGHSTIQLEDLKTYDRQSRAKKYIIYALDTSGSMKGEKIGVCKRAGIALAYKAIQEKDRVGLIVFGDKIEKIVRPTNNFSEIVNNIIDLKASKETDISAVIKKSIELYPNDVTGVKHLILLSDAMPTIGKKPEKNTLDAAGIAKEANITISIIGIKLDKEGEELAKKIVEISDGKFYSVKELANTTAILLEDYYSS
ncbi:VWA domain-containing protein [Candidatus Woesearchaeota archaeon]|nr:VWA domain-containing protein [Candidatus Woesearchaeota archaeon]